MTASFYEMPALTFVAPVKVFAVEPVMVTVPVVVWVSVFFPDREPLITALPDPARVTVFLPSATGPVSLVRPVPERVMTALLVAVKLPVKVRSWFPLKVLFAARLVVLPMEMPAPLA